VRFQLIFLHPEQNGGRIQTATLEQHPGQDILIGSGSSLADAAWAHPEYRFRVHAIITGSGKLLFPNGTDRSEPKVVATKPCNSGVVALAYVPSDTSGNR
jgi:dihydrofolate reductase